MITTTYSEIKKKGGYFVSNERDGEKQTALSRVGKAIKHHESNYYILRVEFKENEGFQEVGVYGTKRKVLQAEKRIRTFHPYATEVLKERR